MWTELEVEQQTPLVDIRRSPRHFEVPPPLPAMDEPAVYILHPDVMQVNTRKNYVRDRMWAALIYILEYAETKRMMTEGWYNNEDLLVRLRAVFGRVDQVRHHIDLALQQDDTHRKKRNMRFLILLAVRRRKGFQKRSRWSIQWYCKWCFPTITRSVITATSSADAKKTRK